MFIAQHIFAGRRQLTTTTSINKIVSWSQKSLLARSPYRLSSTLATSGFQPHLNDKKSGGVGVGVGAGGLSGSCPKRMSSISSSNNVSFTSISINPEMVYNPSTAAPSSAITPSSPLASILLRRFQVTAEVTVSKIFPAGFGWQYFSCLAGDMGYTATDLGFFCMTGAGDFTGVFLGHSTYYFLKKLMFPLCDIDMVHEVKTGLFLASAAAFSGFAWQPAVNLLQAGDLPWLGVASGTWAVCGLAFYGGLRLFRQIYAPLGIVRPANYRNLQEDAALSLSIGGATGAFVGTDIVYLPDQNLLKDVVGVLPTDSALQGCAKAGSSTALGFTVAQAAQNVVYKKGQNWID